MKTFQLVRERSSNFCAVRDWQEFHTPINLLLALAGESGEVCEIFQWKGSLEKLSDLKTVFSEKEIVNIGEEIADVFIYSTRLSDVCSIDLANSVRQIYLQRSAVENLFSDSMIGISISTLKRADSIEAWDDLSFEELNSSLPDFKFDSIRSQRHTALAIQSQIGKVCRLFGSKSEEDCRHGLKLWASSEVSQLATLLGTVCILLAYLAKQSRHSLSACITEKFAKNDAKYPADLSRGSSAKYTQYAEAVAKKSSADSKWNFTSRFLTKRSLQTILSIAIATSLGFLLGRFKS